MEAFRAALGQGKPEIFNTETSTVVRSRSSAAYIPSHHDLLSLPDDGTGY